MKGQNISKYSKEIRGFVTEYITTHRLTIIGRKLILVNTHKNKVKPFWSQCSLLEKERLEFILKNPVVKTVSYKSTSNEFSFECSQFKISFTD